VSLYQKPQGKRYKRWDDVFNNSQPMGFMFFNTGTITGPLQPYTEEDSLPDGYEPSTIIDSAVMVFHFSHPEKGDVLIDSGFDRSFYEDPPYGNLPFIVKKFLKLNKVQYAQKKDEDLLSHVTEHHLNPSHVFLTHMHPDHTAGLTALSPECNVYFGKKENSLYYRMATGSHLKERKNIFFLDVNSGASIMPFEKALDIFGDGTLWALSTPGHTKGHMAYLINTLPDPVLIVGDAELSAWGMENGVLMNTDYGQKGKKDVRKSAEMIRTFHKMYPHVQVWFTHDEQGKNYE